MKARTWLGMIGLVAMALVAAQATDAWARAAGGGSRGSRSYTAPVRPAPSAPSMPTTPSRRLETPPPARPSPFGGFGGILGGLLVGGLIGGLLFGHPGFGVGLLDVLLVGGGLLLVVSVLRGRRQEQRPAYAMAGGGDGAWAPTMEVPAAGGDLDRGLAHIRSMDPGFDPAAFGAAARQAFLDVQRAVGSRDIAPLRSRLTPEMQAVLQGQAEELRSARRTNRVEQVDFRRADLGEAWQETGRDFVTVVLAGTLIDYTLDDAGRVVDGSRTAPQEFEEFWTFTRPVGPNPWQLSAIQPA
jgi:predicted lipid-binding transport protein (Tim44 family)